jgi:Flp pilus assembly protein TadD
MRFVTLLVVLGVCGVAVADVLVLDDGTRVQGKARKVDDQWIVTDAAGHETAVPAGKIKEFILGGNESHTPADRLAELRGTAERLSDLRQIIGHYETFLKSVSDAAVADQAKADLADWKKKADEGCEKIGSRWLTRMERDELAESEAAEAARIRDMIDQGRTDEATTALETALSDDPENPAALYLQALLFGQENQTAEARSDLERLSKIVPTHGPTFNNLGVILWRQRLNAAALIAYVQAMKSRPGDETILDNVVEALNGLPGESASAPVVRQAAAILVDQDQQLAARKRARGLYRWGSTWVTAEQLAKLSAEEATQQAELAKVQGQYNDARAALANDEASLRQTEAWLQLYSPPPYMNQLQSTVPAVITPEYVQLQQDYAFTQQELAVAKKRVAELGIEMGRIRQNISMAKYTGRQQMIGTEGTPIRVEEATTEPAK